MKAIRDHLELVGLLAMGPLLFAGCLAGLIAFLAAAHAMAPFVFMGAVGYFLLQAFGRSQDARTQHRQKVKEGQRRVQLMIQAHMAAHGMVDTPQNRTHVLQLLCRPAKRRGSR